MAVVVVLMGWFCLKNCKKAVDKRLGEKKVKSVNNFDMLIYVFKF